MSDAIQTLRFPRIPLSLTLGALGLLGASSFYLSNLPIPAEIADMVSPEAFRTQVIIGPAIMVIIAGFIGHIFAHRAGLGSPFFASLFAGRPDYATLRRQAYSATLTAGVLLMVGLSAQPLISLAGIEAEFAQLNAFSNQGLHAGTKILYGAFAEEIIMRWGLFSVIAFGCLKLIGGFSRTGAMLLAMLITSLIVNAIHAPTLGQILGSPSAMLVLLVQGFGFLASLFACHLYVHRGLEAAMMFKLLLIITSLLASGLALLG